MPLSYLLSKIQVSLQNGHLGRKGNKLCLPLGQRPPDVVVDVGSVRVLVQCKLKNIVNSEQGRCDLVLLTGLLLAYRVPDKVGVLEELKGAPQNFEFICEYHTAGFK